MDLLLDLGEVFVLVHVVLDLGLAHSGSLGGSALPGEVARFIAVVALASGGGRFRLYLGRVSIGCFLAELCHVSPASLGVGPGPSVGWGSSSR